MEDRRNNATATDPLLEEESLITEKVSLFEQKLECVIPLSKATCISRVPRSLRKVNEEAYIPQVVAIGPYHHGSERLQAIEEHKMRYLSDFLTRVPKISFQDCFKTLRALEESSRQCYAEQLKEDSYTFVEIMLLDGCFIVELFIKYWYQHKDQDVVVDPLLRFPALLTSIRIDMLLLENQIPIIILEYLFSLYVHSVPFEESFLTVVLHFFHFSTMLSAAEDTPRAHGKHFLDLLRECCLPSSPHLYDGWKNQVRKSIPNATKLYISGVKFRERANHCFLNLNYNDKVFEIPHLIVTETSEVLFRNLIALEQCFKTSQDQFICEYMSLMNSLISSRSDVEVLQRHEIIENHLSNNEEVSHLFNKISLGIAAFESSYYSKLAESVSNYYNMHPVRAKMFPYVEMLVKDYFYSPWASASTIAVVIVVACTVIQTVCSLISLKSGS